MLRPCDKNPDIRCRCPKNDCQLDKLPPPVHVEIKDPCIPWMPTLTLSQAALDEFDRLAEENMKAAKAVEGQVWR